MVQSGRSWQLEGIVSPLPVLLGVAWGKSLASQGGGPPTEGWEGLGGLGEPKTQGRDAQRTAQTQPAGG